MNKSNYPGRLSCDKRCLKISMNINIMFIKRENCGRQSSKIARKLSKRAEFLGPNIEIARQNWYFISVNNPPPSKSSYLEVITSIYLNS